MSSPFPGLVPFTENDADYFEGRTGETKLVAANLVSAQLTLFYGESGTGKSSLLSAGVLRAMRQRSLAEVERRGRPRYRVALLRSWSGTPVNELLDGLGVKPDGGGLAEGIGEAASLADSGLLVILDQFEEYFRYIDNGKGDAGDFARQFVELWQKDLPAHFLISLREESLGILDRFKGHMPDPFENYLRLEHLSTDECRKYLHATTCPALD